MLTNEVYKRIIIRVILSTVRMVFMKVEVGYITSWRRAIFFSVIFSVVIFGVASTLCTSYIGQGLVSNIISVGVLVLCIAGFILVLADKGGRYTGTGTAVIEGGKFSYNDKKRHINIDVKDVTKVDIEPIKMGETSKVPLAFRLVICCGKKKYFIESDRAQGRDYNQVDLHNLYILLQQNTGKSNSDN